MSAIDNTAFFKIGYGLYVITANGDGKDNGMICNTVTQVTSLPPKIAVTLNKTGYTHDLIRRSGKMNVNALSESAPFSLFQNFGFRSGRDADKFAGIPFTRSENGLAVLTEHCCACFSLKVEQYVDLGTHGMFICSVEEAQVLSQEAPVTYAYYQANIKPQPPKSAAPKGGPKRYICTICGYIYEGDELPPDFICPVCKHPASDFRLLE